MSDHLQQRACQGPAKRQRERQRVWGIRLVEGELVAKAEGPNKQKFGSENVVLSGSKGMAALLENLLVLDKRRREEASSMLVIIKHNKQEVHLSFPSCYCIHCIMCSHYAYRNLHIL